MPSQQASRRKRQQGIDRKPSEATREKIRLAASEREATLDALAREYVPQLRALHQEYLGKRRAAYTDFEQRRTEILAESAAE